MTNRALENWNLGNLKWIHLG